MRIPEYPDILLAYLGSRSGLLVVKMNCGQLSMIGRRSRYLNVLLEDLEVVIKVRDLPVISGDPVVCAVNQAEI